MTSRQPPAFLRLVSGSPAPLTLMGAVVAYVYLQAVMKSERMLHEAGSLGTRFDLGTDAY
ncbi:MAG: hypothetical protein JXO72_14515 [Vicinamibacteria bacterium]|nr:hypothetical protein [Vicinamibacteria bacterium]